MVAKTKTDKNNYICENVQWKIKKAIKKIDEI
jgi:hypothetical protein